MFSLFARAGAGLNLLPAERMLLKALQGALAVAFVAAAPILGNVLMHPAHIDWTGTINAVIGASATALLIAFMKYVSAKGDQQLPDPDWVPTGKLPTPTPAAPAPQPAVPPAPANATAL